MNKIFKIRRYLYLNQICRRTKKHHNHHNLKVILIHLGQQILRSNHHHLKIHLRLNPQEAAVGVDKVVVDKVVVEAKVAVVAAAVVLAEETSVVVVAVEKGNRLHKQPAGIMRNLNGTIFINNSF
jgi:hypothetical protein